MQHLAAAFRHGAFAAVDGADRQTLLGVLNQLVEGVPNNDATSKEESKS